MSLNERSLDAVRGLLKTECTVALTGVGDEHGSGVFIDWNVVLTCAHVVGGNEGQEVTVHLVGGAERVGVVKESLPGNDLDLALVEVQFLEGDTRPPAVALEPFLKDNIDYYAVGYPREALTGQRGMQEVSYRVSASYQADNVTPRSLALQSGGALVQPGISGGALLSPQSGAVVGIVQWSNNPDSDTGGGAIPINRVTEHLTTVKALVKQPPQAARAWRDALGPDAWQKLGFEWEWQSQLDILISGTVEEWTIRLEPNGGDPYKVTGQGLPHQVARALFHWAQRRRVHDAEDVDLLGRLLGGALLPEHLVERVTQAAESDRLFIRLCFDEGTELFDVPWEFVQMQYPGGERQLALDRSTRLSRIAPRLNVPPGGVDLAPRRAPAAVLGIVMQPEDWQSQMPRIIDDNAELPWPTSDVLMSELDQAATAAGIMTTKLLEGDPTQTKITRAIDELRADNGVPAEVVHYLGFGVTENGAAKYAIFEGLNGIVRWRPLSDLFESAVKAGARLLVVQFLSPRAGWDPAPVTPRAFLPALRGSICAVVFTTLPVHPREAIAFNKKLYSTLREGKTIEEAVQAARTEMREGEVPLEEDSASFGWFSLLTGPDSGLRLLEAHAGGAGRTSTDRGGQRSPREPREGAPNTEQAARPDPIDRGGFSRG